MGILSTLKQEADTPENFGNNGTQWRRQCRTLSGEQGVEAVNKELMAFVPATLKSKEAGKFVPDVSQAALCTTALVHGLVNDLAALKKFCPRFDKAHVRYMRQSFGLVLGYKAKADKALLDALKKLGHYGAANGLVKVGQPVFFLDDTEAKVIAPKATVIPTVEAPKGKGKGKPKK